MKIRTGTIAEHKAVLWLWEQGYEVFVNPCHTGPADLLAIDQRGSILRIDVKCVTGNNTKIYNRVKPEQKAIGVIGLYYDEGTFLWEHEIPVKRRK